MSKRRARGRRVNALQAFNKLFVKALSEGNGLATYRVGLSNAHRGLDFALVEDSAEGSHSVAGMYLRVDGRVTPRAVDEGLYTFLTGIVKTMMLTVEDAPYKSGETLHTPLELSDSAGEVNRVLIVDLDTERATQLQVHTAMRGMFPREREHERIRDDEGDLIALSFALASHIRRVENKGRAYALGEAMEHAIELLNDLYTDAGMTIKNEYEDNNTSFHNGQARRSRD